MQIGCLIVAQGVMVRHLSVDGPVQQRGKVEDIHAVCQDKSGQPAVGVSPVRLIARLPTQASLIGLSTHWRQPIEKMRLVLCCMQYFVDLAKWTSLAPRPFKSDTNLIQREVPLQVCRC